jgi:phytoene dehydrogenase-like protein
MNMKKSIIIIGAGMGGLAAGIYGQRSGFATAIFEAQASPGGQCTSWNRKGYVFDPTLHEFNGFKNHTRINAFWRELGALPCEMVKRNEFVSAVFPDGTYFHNWFDLKKLRAHLKELSPADAAVIDGYVNGITSFVTELDWFGINYFGSVWEKLTVLPFFAARMKYFKYTLGSFAKRFTSPYLRQAFPLIRHSVPDIPLFAYLVEHANFINNDSGWPGGGSITPAKNMAARYLKLGGTLYYRKKVVKILTEHNRACGIELEDGTRYKADFIVSNADGRKTILKLLDGRYMSRRVAEYCAPNPPDGSVPQATQVFLGVKQDLSSYPSSLIMFLAKPEHIAGQERDHLDMQIYGFDARMAPPGKGVIKIELSTTPSYFSNLYNDKTAYKKEKNRTAGRVISLLERRFPGLRKDIEVIDVTTLNTWERFMGGTNGWSNFPNKYNMTGIRNVINILFGLGRMFTLPKLKNFFFAGQWVTSMGSVFMNAASGREVVRKICRQCGVQFAHLSRDEDPAGR